MRADEGGPGGGTVSPLGAAGAAPVPEGRRIARVGGREACGPPRSLLAAMLLMAVGCSIQPAPAQRGPEVDPATVGMDADALARVDAAVVAAIADGATPGAALAIGRRGRLVRLRGYGRIDHAADAPLATSSTIWDLASLTKVVGTTTALMILVDEGRLALSDPVVRHLPGWDRGDARKARVTVRDLLLHRAGLAPFRRWFFELSGPDAYREAVYDEPLEADPGERTAYSDIGVITLGLLVEAITAEGMDAFLRARVFEPLGMLDTGFLPDAQLLARIAPTERDTVWRHEHVRGRVHDENADAMGGVAGHAGLFSTALDLAVFADLMLGGGEVPACIPADAGGVPCPVARPGPVRLLADTTVERFTRRFDAGSSRALGWDTPEGRSSAGDYFTARAFGHTGFTGTSIWVDPELDLFVVLLTNRVNPTRANQAHVPLRRAVHDLAALAIADRPVPPRSP